jgi:electron transport complex protein RnfG
VGSYIRLVITLTAIAAAASFGLSAVYNATHEITEEYKRLETENARIEVLPTEGGEFFEETVTDSILDGRQFVYYTAYASEAREVVRGYTFTAYGKGYSSTIETIVGMVPDGSISGIKIVDQKETPGLGAKVQEVASRNTLWAVIGGNAVDETGTLPWFQEQYRFLRAADLRVVKSAGEDGILAITGATISSDAVTESVKRGLEMLASVVTIGEHSENGRWTPPADTLAVDEGVAVSAAEAATAAGGEE